MAWFSGRCSKRRPRRGDDAAEPKDVRGVAIRWCSGLLATLAFSGSVTAFLGASASPPKEILGASIEL
eukprot:CAMPEP_0181417520 /NCGR_PEP_ID=MMETSP1110-20121109/11083_1 /TAXON_ID=174948 /ORGANISM="Symbiodinium sp., Strain CCMP421" /LENGTH=67 /DNA_ID=CAMNT_0023540473 /DNA_START=1127 /DNA_END=1326 /DNA_ORIENTATION=-